MKKLICIFALIFISISSFAQIQNYRSTHFSYKIKNENGVWGDWSKWENSNLKIIFDLSNDIITIKSQKLQVYRVLEYLDNFIDSAEGKQVEFLVIDQDYDRGHMRLRIEKNGRSQIYVDFDNIILCYVVVRTD